jgi:hypothetical protein
LGDIIDLPMRAEAVDALLAAGDSGLVAAFEGLTVLEGTANNIKEAWRRWVVTNHVMHHIITMCWLIYMPLICMLLE